jgi:hypothetical protein
MSNDCKRRGAVLRSTTGSVLGIDIESDELPHDQRLYRESESVRSEPS